MALEGRNENRLNGEVIHSFYWCMLMLLERTQKISYSTYRPDFISSALKDGHSEGKHQTRSFNWDESMAEGKMQVKIVDAFYKLQQLNHLFPFLPLPSQTRYNWNWESCACETNSLWSLIHSFCFLYCVKPYIHFSYVITSHNQETHSFLMKWKHYDI